MASKGIASRSGRPPSRPCMRADNETEMSSSQSVSTCCNGISIGHLCEFSVDLGFLTVFRTFLFYKIKYKIYQKEDLQFANYSNWSIKENDKYDLGNEILKIEVTATRTSLKWTRFFEDARKPRLKDQERDKATGYDRNKA